MTDPHADGHDAPGQPSPDRWKALAVCLVGGFMVLLDVSIVNVALPSIREGLHAPQSELQWVVSGYALTFGLFLVPAGRLGDMRGRRGVFVVGLALFTLASVLCGAAQTSLWLVLARLAQGVAGGTVTPQISAVIQQMFSGRERAKAFGIFGSVVGISTAIGPLVGGLLISAFGTDTGWRWVFFVNLPIGIAALPLAWRLLPGTPSDRRGGHDLDPVGVGLLGAGVVVLLLPFVQEQQWKGSAKWLLVPVAAVLLVAFLLWERRYAARAHEPLVDLSLFRLRSYSFGTGLILLYFAGFTPLFFVFTLFLQVGLKYSALTAGLATMPFALGSAVSAALSGRAVSRIGRPLVALGLVLVALGLFGTFVAAGVAPKDGTGLAMVVPLLIAGIGGGLVIAPNQTLTLAEVPVEHAGTAGGLLQTSQRIGAAVGIAAVGSVFFAHIASSHGQDYADAYRAGILLAAGFVVLALVVSVVDVLVTRPHASPGRHVASSQTGAEAGQQPEVDGHQDDETGERGPARRTAQHSR